MAIFLYARDRMVRPSHWLALFFVPFIILTCQSGWSETIQDCLTWAPVFQRNFGNPKIVIKDANKATPRVQAFYPTNTVFVKTPLDTGAAEIDRALSDHYLQIIWGRYFAPKALSRFEKRLRMKEIIPISQEDFFRIGRSQLKNRSCGNQLEDDWWKVRMGMPLTESDDHLLAVTTLIWDDPARKSFGHYAFALRNRGGNPQDDSLYDFRAPWSLDRRARIGEAQNFGNKLKIKAIRENLYDWLYTQTEYRNNHVKMSFLKIHEEQVTLLQAFDNRVHEAGNFRVLKKNCASLGRQFVNRLLPVDQEIRGINDWADLPFKTYEDSIKILGGAICEVEIPNYTQERGRTPTNRSTMHSATPSKPTSRPFQLLKEVPDIN